jgi:hypothetical protein
MSQIILFGGVTSNELAGCLTFLLSVKLRIFFILIYSVSNDLIADSAKHVK